MSEQHLLLLACLKQPDDRTARLVYADWLDEHPDLPAAGATAEFIRLACRPVKGPWGMPKEAYLWLKPNWKRLVPSVVALSIPITEPSDRWPTVPPDGMFDKVTGSHVETYVTLRALRWDGSSKLYSCRLRMRFYRGLLESWLMNSKFGRERVEPALRADRPELFLEPVRVSQVPDSGTCRPENA